MDHDSDARLLAPYRSVRRVTAPGDGPWSGTLVRRPSGDAGVLVTAEALGPEWAGWDASASGHLLAPLDLVRSAYGHSVLLPPCVERLDDFLARRRGAAVPVGVGEVVTIGVSLVRAIAELGGRADHEEGEWWLTDARRPVLVTGCGGQSATLATSAVVHELARAMPDSAWDDLLALTGRERIAERDVGRVEDALFARGAAEPLADAPLATSGGRRSLAIAADGVEPRTLSHVRSLAAYGVDEAALPAAVARPSRNWIDQLSRHIDADVADAVSQVTTGAWRRLRAHRGRSRRAPWLLAGGVAVVVVAGGLLWPTGGTAPVNAAPGPTATAASRTAAVPGTTAPAAPTPAAPHDADLAVVAADLLTARSACAGDAACLSTAVRGAAQEFPPGAVDLAPDARTVVLVDDFGGVAVLRVDDATGALPPQLIVMQQEERRWLLRDVYAAQQP